MQYMSRLVQGDTLESVVTNANNIARGADFVDRFTELKVMTYDDGEGNLSTGYKMHVNFFKGTEEKNYRRIELVKSADEEDAVELGNRFLDSAKCASPIPYTFSTVDHCNDFFRYVKGESGEDVAEYGYWYVLVEHEQKVVKKVAKTPKKTPSTEHEELRPSELEKVVGEEDKGPGRWERFKGWYSSTDLYQRIFKSKEADSDAEYKLPLKGMVVKTPIKYTPLTLSWFSAGYDARRIRFANWWRKHVSQKYQDWKEAREAKKAAKEENVENPGPSLAPEEDIAPFGFTDLVAPPTEGMQPQVYTDNYANQTVENGYGPVVQQEVVPETDTPTRKVRKVKKDESNLAPAEGPSNHIPVQEDQNGAPWEEEFPMVPSPDPFISAPEPTPMYDPNEEAPEEEPVSDLPLPKFVPAVIPKKPKKEDEEAD